MCITHHAFDLGHANTNIRCFVHDLFCNLRFLTTQFVEKSTGILNTRAIWDSGGENLYTAILYSLIPESVHPRVRDSELL